MLNSKSKIFLFPYYFTLKIRHFLYDKNIFKIHSFPIPVICVGNVTVGGTGKTPHCEMIIRLLKEKYKIALLSRGYKRTTKGFLYVTTNNTFREVGDEPLQIKQKFSDISVAVCREREIGIDKLITEQNPELIILDDALQYRKIRASHSIVLVNYNNPVDNDNLLPIGTLRDLPSRIHKADTIIVTSLPFRSDIDEDTDSEDIAEYIKKQNLIWRKRLSIHTNQNLFFSVIIYKNLSPIFQELADTRYIYSKTAILFSGIANDSSIRSYLSRKYIIKESIQFEDHKDFSAADIKLINKFALNNPISVIITTEKDSKRISESNGLNEGVKARLFYLPIEVNIIPNQQQDFFLQEIVKLPSASK